MDIAQYNHPLLLYVIGSKKYCEQLIARVLKLLSVCETPIINVKCVSLAKELLFFYGLIILYIKN